MTHVTQTTTFSSAITIIIWIADTSLLLAIIGRVYISLVASEWPWFRRRFTLSWLLILVLLRTLNSSRRVVDLSPFFVGKSNKQGILSYLKCLQ